MLIRHALDGDAVFELESFIESLQELLLLHGDALISFDADYGSVSIVIEPLVSK